MDVYNSFPVHLVVLAAVSPAWYWAGRLTARCKLPLITGFMLAGVASGPTGLGLITSAGLGSLRLVDHVCLSLIALAAGAELQMAELRKIKRQVTWITLSISACTWAFTFACMLALAPYVPFTASAPPHAVTAIASLMATLAVARSPASAIAVLKEMEGKGPYCSLVMAVVVLKDVLVFVAFALNIELAQTASKSGQAISAAHLLEPLARIALSVALGVACGVVLGALAAGWNPAARLLPAALRTRLRPLAVLAVSGGTFLLSEAAGAEPLLSCVTAGLLVANRRFGHSSTDVIEVLGEDVGRLMPTVNVVFFGLVGASLKLAAVRDTLWAAALLYLVRLAGIWLGCNGGAILGGAPEAIGGKVWMGMVTQAGIALGLARIVSGKFPEWGPDFSALATGMVLMNLFTGPPLFKAAVIAAGEARALGLPRLAPEFANGGVRRNPSMRELPIPEIPIISVLQPGADALAAAGAQLKHLMGSAGSAPRETLAS